MLIISFKCFTESKVYVVKDKIHLLLPFSSSFSSRLGTCMGKSKFWWWDFIEPHVSISLLDKDVPSISYMLKKMLDGRNMRWHLVLYNFRVRYTMDATSYFYWGSSKIWKGSGVIDHELHPKEMEIGKEISVVSHSFLLDNYEIYVRPKWDCGWFLLFLSCFSWDTGEQNLKLGSL